MRARVELRGALTHRRGGVTFKKGQAQTITDPAAVAYYKSTGGFSVTMLEEETYTRVKEEPKESPPKTAARKK